MAARIVAKTGRANSKSHGSPPVDPVGAENPSSQVRQANRYSWMRPPTSGSSELLRVDVADQTDRCRTFIGSPMVVPDRAKYVVGGSHSGSMTQFASGVLA
jgi:hypothetical protein